MRRGGERVCFFHSLDAHRRCSSWWCQSCPVAGCIIFAFACLAVITVREGGRGMSKGVALLLCALSWPGEALHIHNFFAYYAPAERLAFLT